MLRSFAVAACSAFLILGISASVYGQTTREEMLATPEKNGGVYLAYPVDKSENTSAPKGYKPFYISHMGRHGSRYLINESDYVKPIKALKAAKKAGVLTDLGKDVLKRIENVFEEADGRSGDLSPLGVRQHKAIADRMYKAYPEVFTDDCEMTARSTMVMRCAMSMTAFCESLKEHNPKLNIVKEPSYRHVRYLYYQSPEMKEYNAPEGPWREGYKQFTDSMTHTARLMSTLFTDTAYVNSKVNAYSLMWNLYMIAIDMQNVETKENLFDLFTGEELFDMWQTRNYKMYAQVCNHAMSKGAVLASSKPLVRNIIESADEHVKSGKNGADLRFGHDVNILPLAGLLGFPGCTVSVGGPEGLYTKFADYKISPMCANIQMILFRNKKGNVLAKFMLNEREVKIPVETDNFPFYDWDKVKAYYMNVVNE